MLVPYKDDFYSDSTLVLGLVHVEFFNVCLNSRRWFVLCLAYISYIVLSADVWKQELALSMGAN
jgi:hypothetical protein